MLRPLTRRGLLACGLLLSSLLAGCDMERPAQTTQATAIPTAIQSTPTASANRTPVQAPGGVVLQPTVTPPLAAAPLRGSSIDKIETALSEGRIDQDTALVHLMVAAYDPSALPAEFKSDLAPVTMEGTTLLAPLTGRLDKLEPTLRAQVQSFLRRPTDPQSFWYKRLTGSEASAAVGRAAGH